MSKSPSQNYTANDAASKSGNRGAVVDGWEQPVEAQAPRAGQAARPISRADARELWLLLLMVFAGLASEQAITVLMPLAADARGASIAWIGILSGSLRLVLVLLLIPGTWLVTMWGRRMAVIAGVGLQGAASLVYALIPDVRWMLLPQIILGVGLSIFWPAFLSYFAEVAAGAAHQMQMRRSLAQGVALLLSPVLGTYLAGQFSYDAGFAAIGAMTIVAALVGFRLTGSAGRAAGAPGGPAALLGAYRAAGTLLRRPAFALAVGLSIVGSLLIYLVSGAFLTLHLRRLGLASLTIGTLISLRSFSDVALRMAFSSLAARIRPLYLMVLSVVGVAVIDLLLPVLTTPTALVVLMLLLGALASQYDPATVTVLSDLLRADERDVGVAVWVTINSLIGWMVAPALGSLGDFAGLSAVFIVAACVGLAVVAALMVWGRNAAEKPAAPDELVEMFW